MRPNRDAAALTVGRPADGVPRQPFDGAATTIAAAAIPRKTTILFSDGRIRTASGGPGERVGETRLALVPDPEGVDVRALRLRSRQLRPGRMKHADQPHRLPRLDAEGDDVLDLEVDGVPDLRAVAETLLHDLDRRPLDAEHLTDERSERLHRSALLPAEDCCQLLHLLVR